MEKIAWIGLGTMGTPMARNASKNGFQIVAYNRTTREVPLDDVPVTNSIQEAVSDADVICIMVSDGPAVHDILFGSGNAVEYMKQNAVVVNMSTIGVEETRNFALQLNNHGLEWMDAPVSGSRGPAEEGSLVFLVGGLESTYTRLRPFFLTMGKEAFYLGPVSSGAAMKLLVNAYLGATVEAVSECMAIANKAGLDAMRYLDVLKLTSMWSGVLAGKSGMWEKDEYPQAFALKHMTKDLGLMNDFSRSLSAGTPTLSTVTQLYLSGVANDLAEHDMASVFRVASLLAGVDSQNKAE